MVVDYVTSESGECEKNEPERVPCPLSGLASRKAYFNYRTRMCEVWPEQRAESRERAEI